MDRTLFYKQATVNGIDELDMLWNRLSNFTMNYTPVYYRVTVHDVMQPDNISYNMYGTERYWWIICLVNGIMNPFDELVIGTVLKLPNIVDIEDFYRQYVMR